MTGLDEIKLELDIHFKRIDSILPEINGYLPLSKDDFDNIEIIKAIDSFILRFTKIQDKMGDKLFPAVLDKLQEYKRSMSLLDVLNKLEKLEYIDSTEEWIGFRALRNILTHEYPTNQDEIAEAVELAIDSYNKMKRIYMSMVG